MPETSIADAKTHLTRLIADAERGEVVRITRRGKPVAVLLSEDEYARLSEASSRASFGALIAEMRADPAFAPVDWRSDEVDSWRDRRPSRDFEWPE
jgi:prevent-host-death family protein